MQVEKYNIKMIVIGILMLILGINLFSPYTYADTAKYGHSNYNIALKNINIEDKITILFSQKDQFTSENHYENLIISFQNGKIIEAYEEDCGIYSYSGDFYEKHTNDIINKVSLEMVEDNNFILKIDNLTENEIVTTNNLSVSQNDIEIINYSDNDYFIDKNLNTDDGYNIYTYKNIEINFANNDVKVIRTGNTFDASKIKIYSLFIFLIILIIVIIIKKKKSKK